MERIMRARFGAVLASLALLLGLAPAAAGLAAPAPVAVQVTASAEAAVGGSQVINKSGSPVLVRCDYSSNTGYLPNSGRLYEEAGTRWPNSSTHFCPVDVDQFRSESDARCIKYVGPGYTDGYYKIAANKWYKISDLATVSVYSYYAGSPDWCAGRSWFTHV